MPNPNVDPMAFKRRRLRDSLVRQGIPMEKAQRIASAVHRKGAAQPKRAKPTAKQPDALWLPPGSEAAIERRKRMTAVERVSKRLAESMGILTSIAHSIAAESMRRVDTKKAQAA